MYQFIEALRALAVVFIVNSHLKGVYPSDSFSFGAGMGLALFYMISGYLLAGAAKREHLGKWYVRKVLRLYIPLWIYKTVMVGVGYEAVHGFGGFFRSFLFPAYWFVASMVVMYGVYGLFVKKIYRVYGKASLYAALALSAGVFGVLYGTKAPIGALDLRTLTVGAFELEKYSFMTQWIWFGCMLLGLMLAGAKGDAASGKNRVFYLFGAVFFFGLSVWMKGLLREPGPESLMVLPEWFYVGFGYCLFQSFMGWESLWQRMADKKVWKLTELLSRCSLEIYYCQFFWIHVGRQAGFPFNLFCIWGGIGVSGYLLHRFSQIIISRLERV